MPDANTADLERRAVDGNAAAFASLLRLWDGDLRGVAWAVVGGNGLDDVMQSAYERAFRAIDSFGGRSSMKTWLHSIVYRTAIDHARYEGRRRHDNVDDAGVLPLTKSTATESEALDQMEIGELLRRLSSDQREALMLTIGLGYSYDEAAEITGESRGTIASRVNRARSRLERWDTEER